MVTTEAPTSLAALAQELDVLIRARYPLLAVATHEEGRFRRLLEAVALRERHAAKGLFHWSRTAGLRQIAGPGAGVRGRDIPDTLDPLSVLDHIAAAERGLFLLADFGAYLAPYGQEEPLLVRRLRELAWAIKARPVTVIFVGPDFPALPTLDKEVKRLDLPLPDEREVAALLDLQLARLADNPDLALAVDAQTREHLVGALLGLTETEIENALARAAIALRGIGPAAVPLILAEKRGVIRGSGALTYTHPAPVDHLGGYASVRRFLEEAAVTFTPAARAFGVEPAKGVLLVGLPGTGKDLLKRIAAGILGRPLLDLDFGSVMGEGGGVLGSAATSVKRALAIATTVKGILGISEFEKAVGGLQSSNRSDGGETARTIALLLNWMADQQEVFVMATANDVRQLAPEQLRQGRFAQVLFVDLPTPEDRAAIFRVHLAKRGRDPEGFDLAALAAASEGFSGAEIEAAVKGALVTAFMDGARAVTTADVLARARGIRPTSAVKREEIAELRRWAQEHLALDAGTGAPAAGERLMEF
ncbi:MAG TPA: AAA family ATPase [Thermomicrobiales bacterium]|nr:AAA family ATPase [Thermomicrobiales bacterium]